MLAVCQTLLSHGLVGLEPSAKMIDLFPGKMGHKRTAHPFSLMYERMNVDTAISFSISVLFYKRACLGGLELLV